MITPVELRRELHRHPELSFEEQQTAARIGKALTEAGIAWRPIAQTGILARIEGRGDLHKAVVLRADIDALPITEAVSVAWQSEKAGVMHACGHDMHAAILYGVLCSLKEGDFEGTLFGLFQPGEELTPGGAKSVLMEEPFAGYEVQAVLGEHVEPDLEVGEVGLKAGKYMAGNNELRLHIQGRGGHAALRERIQDTVSAAARLILKITDLNSPERILSIGRIEAAGATNVIPDSVELEGTMRIFSESDRVQLHEELLTICKREELESGISVRLDISEGYPAVVNDHSLTERARNEALKCGLVVKELALRPTSEDFGRYGLNYPALFYRLGVGRSSGALHSPQFNPDERALEVGIRLMSRLALNLLR